MAEDSLLPFDLPAVSRKKMTADFAGGSISSDGALLLLRAAPAPARAGRDDGRTYPRGGGPCCRFAAAVAAAGIAIDGDDLGLAHEAVDEDHDQAALGNAEPHSETVDSWLPLYRPGMARP